MAGKVTFLIQIPFDLYIIDSLYFQQSEAIEMCLNYNVKLTESLADQLMGSHNGTVNNHLLTQLAEAAQRQGDYQLAAKKFTQSGDKVSGISIKM